MEGFWLFSLGKGGILCVLTVCSMLRAVVVVNGVGGT